MAIAMNFIPPRNDAFLSCEIREISPFTQRGSNPPSSGVVTIKLKEQAMEISLKNIRLISEIGNFFSRSIPARENPTPANASAKKKANKIKVIVIY
jgi:hypothetical protein